MRKKLQAELRADRLEAASKDKTEAEISAALEQSPEIQGRVTHLEERLERDLVEFEEHSQKVEKLLHQAEERIKTAQESTASVKDKLELAALYPTLVAIEGQHRNFHSHALNLITADDLSPAARERIEEQLEAEAFETHSAAGCLERTC